jgi:hypothetical protein
MAQIEPTFVGIPQALVPFNSKRMEWRRFLPRISLLYNAQGHGEDLLCGDEKAVSSRKLKGCHGSPKNRADLSGTYRVDEQRLL